MFNIIKFDNINVESHIFQLRTLQIVSNSLQEESEANICPQLLFNVLMCFNVFLYCIVKLNGLFQGIVSHIKTDNFSMAQVKTYCQL